MNNFVRGFNLPGCNYGRDYGLIKEYKKTWTRWLQLTGKNIFNYGIPTNGIVESIEKITNLRYRRYVIFEGEVGFYKFQLEYNSKNYITIRPDQFDLLKEGDLICLSMPFSPIGGIPDWYFDLCKFIKDRNIEMFIDGAYLGTIDRPLYIPDNCKWFAVSISKCFNASALRAGILFCDNIPSSFKPKVAVQNYNYSSMKIAIDLLEKYSYLYMHKTYSDFQLQMCNTYDLIPAQSVVLAYTHDQNHRLKTLMSYNKELQLYRYCIPSAYDNQYNF